MIITNTITFGTLFLKNLETGERCKLNNIENIEMCSHPIELDRIHTSILTAQNIGVTGEIKLEFLNKNSLLYVSGLPVPNNWLKIKGLPMKRKLRKKYEINYRA